MGLFKFLFFIIFIALVFFVGYLGGVMGWLPAVSSWFGSWIKK